MPVLTAVLRILPTLALSDSLDRSVGTWMFPRPKKTCNGGGGGGEAGLVLACSRDEIR